MAITISASRTLIFWGMMLGLKIRTIISFPFSLAFSPSKRLKSSPFKPYTTSFSPFNNFTTKMSSRTIEHIVLFKVKDDVDQSKANTMTSRLNGLISLDQVIHLSAGPLLRNRSSSSNFTHILHSRYKSKEDLSDYSAHPNHLSVVKESVLPICDDVMAVDWIAEDLQGPVVPPSGSVLRVTFLKLKENLGDEVKNEVLEVVKGIKDKFGQINQLSVGGNFSPGRAKGFSIASIAVFPGVSELEAVDSNQELVNLQKEKVRDYLESVIVVDYVVPSPQTASL